MLVRIREVLTNLVKVPPNSVASRFVPAQEVLRRICVKSGEPFEGR